MKKISLCIIIIIIFIIFFNGVSLTLQDEIVMESTELYLYDIIDQNEKFKINNIKLAEIEHYPNLITAERVLYYLEQNNINDVVIIGDQTRLLKRKKVRKKSYHPVTILKNELSKLLNHSYDIEIEVIKTIPPIALNNLDEPCYWEIRNINNILNFIQDTNQLKLNVGTKEIDVHLNIQLFSYIYQTPVHLKKGSIIDQSNFNKKIININYLNNPDELITSIKKHQNFYLVKDLNPGDILRNSDLKKIPLVKKGDTINIFFNDKNFQLTITGISMENGFENEKLKVKLLNGNILYGILKMTDEGEKYVEKI